MTASEQPDTASIRAYFAKFSQQYSTGIPVIALCDALEAARVERDDKAHESDHWSGWADTYKERAEAAEQKRDNYELLWRAAEDEQNAAIARAEAAEARARHADERCDMHARDCAEAEARIMSLETKLRGYTEHNKHLRARIDAALAALNSADDMEYRIRIARRALTGGTE